MVSWKTPQLRKRVIKLFEYDEAIYLALGFIASLLGSMSGLGGGFITIPVLYYLGIPMTYAAATSKFMVLVTSTVSSVRYYGKISVHPWLFLVVSIPMILAAYVGAFILAVLPAIYLTLVVASVLLVSAVRMLLPRREDIAKSVVQQLSIAHYVRGALSGCVAGLVGGVTGLGGGVVNVPVFIHILKLDVKVAVTLSLACMVPSALSAVVRHVLDNVILWKVGIPLGLGAAIGAWLGPSVTIRARRETLRKIIGLLIAIVMIRVLLETAIHIVLD